jgi:hypothetical protein
LKVPERRNVERYITVFDKVGHFLTRKFKEKEMNAYLKLTIGILLVAIAIIGANIFLPHKSGSSFSSRKEIYFIVGIVGLSFLAGFYFIYNSLKEINKKKEIDSR